MTSSSQSPLSLGDVAARHMANATKTTPLLQGIAALRLFGCADHKAGVLSFLLDGHSPEAKGSALNQEGIAVGAGHHCAQPILRRFGVESTVRATFGLYNTHADVDALVAALRRLVA
jgi:cysteine desulfurase/selenocysteine lyase